MDGVDASALDLDVLRERALRDDVREVCVGTNPDLEGDGTALTLCEVLRDIPGRGEDSEPLRITRLARGLPTGGLILWPLFGTTN